MAEIMSSQIIPRPCIVIKTPLKLHRMNSPLSFNSIRFSIACTATSAPPANQVNSVVSTQLLLNKYGLTSCKGLLQSTSTQNLEKTLELLQDYGLSLAQIRKIIVYNPRFLTLNAHNNIKPKLEFFNSFMNDKDVAKLVSSNARPLQLSLEPRLKSAVLFLQKCGFEGEALVRLLTTAPELLSISEENVLRLFEVVEGIGFTKGSRMFPIAISAISGLKKGVLEQKLNNLCGLGFSEEEVRVICRRKPRVLGASRDKIKRSVEFLVNSAGVPMSEIVRYPDLLMYSMENRIIPRYRVVKALKSMTEVKRMPKLHGIIKMKEECFLDKFVNAFSAEAPFLWDIYKGESDSKGIGEIEEDS